MDAYLVLVTIADGREGLLFPRSGHVAIADTLDQGNADFETAKCHLLDYMADLWPPSQRELEGITIRLVRFNQMETLKEYKHITHLEL